MEQRRYKRWGKAIADDFAEVCRLRTSEASGSGGDVAQNGTVLEQSQILTTHNLAALIDVLQLADWLREVAPDLADCTFAWAVQSADSAGVDLDH